MAKTYAEFQDLVEQILQDTSNAIYDTTELGLQTEEALKDWDYNRVYPHLVDVRFEIESRTGSDVAPLKMLWKRFARRWREMSGGLK